jgi:hypothetical protein
MSCTVAKLKGVDMSKNLYYTKGNSVMSWNKKSHKKKVLAKFVRDPTKVYFVKKNGTVGCAPKKNPSSRKRKHRR